MSNVKIETLTPVHIGSGHLLYHNTDFVKVILNKEPNIAIISEEKIWRLLSEQHLENWLTAITCRENLKDFLKRFAPEAKSKDYSKRRMPVYCEIKENDVLKECLHNGLGLPYIPGSSIKGAIRTAILSTLANTISDKETKIQVTDRRIGTKIEAAAIEKELFGNNPNSDIFRFIQVGDAYFEKETEIATRLVSLNIKKSETDLFDDTKSQIVEAIGKEATSQFQLKISNEYYNFVKNNYPQVGNLPISSLSDLFTLVNQHTKRLVEDEIVFWQNIDKTGGDYYIEELQKILHEITHCDLGKDSASDKDSVTGKDSTLGKENEVGKLDKGSDSGKPGKSCILRIGHASGWRFITGAWTESLRNFKDAVIPASRPNYKSYAEYDFPKTRRLDEDSYIFGFVKFTLNG